MPLLGSLWGRSILRQGLWATGQEREERIVFADRQNRGGKVTGPFQVSPMKGQQSGLGRCGRGELEGAGRLSVPEWLAPHCRRGRLAYGSTGRTSKGRLDPRKAAAARESPFPLEGCRPHRNSRPEACGLSSRRRVQSLGMGGIGSFDLQDRCCKGRPDLHRNATW